MNMNCCDEETIEVLYHQTINVNKNKVHFDKFIESAVVAGTPDFL